ncbi:hypothetical protein [Streptosporangium roseum]|uniref:hypothetical protein n=1 Tax=Streptosporangium roseum TaxID=2001 RepID=UPI0004CCBA9D|nr:hypothetical protein [Streptosporangium roseum]
MTQPTVTEPSPPPPEQAGYPITALDTLAPAAGRSRFWRRGSVQRKADAVPYPLPHEVVVLRVGRKLVRADDGTPKDRDQDLAAATSYCVVDMTRERPVILEMQVPSEGGLQDFTLRATFACTVRDPLRIAEGGRRDIREALLTYVKSCDGIQHLGMEYGIEAVREAHRRFRSALDTYARTRPPVFTGMMVELTAVEVLTPAEIMEEQRRDESLRRQREKERALEEENIAAQSHIEKLQQELETQRIELQERLHRQKTAFDQERQIVEREFGWKMQYDEAEEKRRRDYRQRTFDIDEGLRLHEAVGTDPDKIEAMTRVQGGLSAGDHLARSDERERLRREKEEEDLRWRRETEREQSRWGRDWEVTRAEWERDDNRDGIQWQRRRQAEARQRAQEIEDRKAAAEAGAGAEVRRRAQELEDRKAVAEAEARRRAEEIEDREAAAQLELVRILVERGHTDQGSMIEHVQRLADELTSRRRPLQHEERAEITRDDARPALQDAPAPQEHRHADSDRPARQERRHPDSDRPARLKEEDIGD